nr:myb domain protein 4r1 [Tanacetum cinerariifolium]
MEQMETIAVVINEIRKSEAVDGSGGFVEEHNHSWARVAACIPPRTDNQCRRRWMVLLPHQVLVLKAAKEIEKRCFVSNFVDRDEERPQLTYKDFNKPLLLESGPKTNEDNKISKDKKRTVGKDRPGRAKKVAHTGKARKLVDEDVVENNDSQADVTSNGDGENCGVEKEATGSRKSQGTKEVLLKFGLEGKGRKSEAVDGSGGFGEMNRIAGGGGMVSQKESGVRRGVKEKDLNRNKKNTFLGIGVFTDSKDTINDDTHVGVASSVQEVVTPSVVEMGMQNSMDDTTVHIIFTIIYAGYYYGCERFANTVYGFFLKKKVAYSVVANYVRNTWGKYGLVRSMFSSSTGLFSFHFSSMDGLDAMLENSPCEDGLRAIATKLGTLLMLDSYTSDMCIQSWGRSSYARVMIELHADLELKDNIVVAMPKITRECHYTFITTPIIDKIGKFEDLLTSGQAILVDKAGNHLKKVEFPGEYDSEDGVASVDNDMARSMTSERVGFGTQSLLEQWRDSYGNGDYDDDYDDDMYDGQDLFHELQAICDNLDIRVRGRKK